MSAFFHLHTSTGLTEGINGLLDWDRRAKLTGYRATEGIKGLVVVGLRDKCTGHTGELVLVTEKTNGIRS